MNGRVIDHPDDLVPGKYVTVVRWVGGDAKEGEIDWSSPFGPIKRGQREQRRDLFGSVLRVVALSLPFMLVRGLDGKLVNLDLRLAVLSPLEPRFVRLMRAKQKADAKASKGRKKSSATRGDTASPFSAAMLRYVYGSEPTKDDDGEGDDE